MVDVYTLTISISLEAAIHPTTPGNERLYKQYVRFIIKTTNNTQGTYRKVATIMHVKN